MKLFKSILPIILVVILSFFSIRSLFDPGFFPIHDDTQVERVFEMSKSLSEGQFPARWVADLGYGYGYPIFNFYAPLSYYFGSFFNLSGFDALISTKVMMGFGVLLSGINMFLLGRKLWGTMGGIISSMFYVYAPYHALNIYVRGDVAEFWAYAFIPLVYFFLLKMFEEYRFKHLVLGAIFYASLILSHNLTAFMITPFLVLFLIIFMYRKREFAYHFMGMIILGLGFSSFYILPAIFEAKYTNVLSIVGGGADFKDHFICLPQLWESGWGFGGSAPGCTDGMSFRLGKLHVVIAAISIAIFILGFFKKLKIPEVKIKDNDSTFYFVVFSILGLLISIFLTLEASRFVWQTLPFVNFLQYPWRFLAFASFFISVLAGFCFWYASAILRIFKKEKLQILLLISLIFLLIYSSAKLFVPQARLVKTEESFIEKINLIWETSRTSDEYMPAGFNTPESINEVPKEKIENSEVYEVLHAESDSSKLSAFIRAKEATSVKVNTAYFPAWNGYVDNKEILLKKDLNGMKLTLPKGDHAVDLVFIQTPLEKLGNAMSIASLFIIFIGIIYTSIKRTNK